MRFRRLKERRRMAKPKEKPVKKEAEAPGAAPLTRFQRFAVTRIDRKQIQGAPYNPRIITPSAKKKLKENIARVGLLDPVVVNKRTMMLVGGHQRLAALDALEGGEYALDVSMVELSETDAREQLVFLNNPAAQGEWDLKALAALLQDDEVDLDLDHIGFDPVELESLFGDTTIALPKLFGREEQSPELQAAIADVERVQEEADAVNARAREAERAAQEAKKSHVLERKQEIAASNQERGDKEFYAIVVFRSSAEREAFQVWASAQPYARYVDGAKVFLAIGKTPEELRAEYETSTGIMLDEPANEPANEPENEDEEEAAQ